MKSPLNKISLIIAERKEADTIAKIHNSNVLASINDKMKKGFLLEKISSAKVLQKMEQPDKRFFIVTDQEGKRIGYLELSENIDQDILSRVDWMAENLSGINLAQKHFYIDVVALKHDKIGKGMGKAIYEGLFKLFPSHVFTACVALYPERNQRSIDFHLKNGFIIAGQYTNKFFGGLTDYRSYLFYRKPCL